MSSRAQLDRAFPPFVERHTDERDFIDWHSVVEELQMEDLTTIRNRVWRWRNAEAWWLRNRKRIIEESRERESEGSAVQEREKNYREPVERVFLKIPVEVNPIQLAFDF